MPLVKPVIILWIFVLSVLSRADELRFPDLTPKVSMRFPDGWEHDNYLNGWFSGYTPDRTVWVSAITFDSLTLERLQKWLPRHLDSFGVEAILDWKTFHSAKARVGSWRVMDGFVSGTTAEGPCEVSLCIFELDEHARFVVTYGGSPENREKYLPDIQKILATVKAVTSAP